MSRIIVKNIPTFVSEKDLADHFRDLGEVTDSKIVRDGSTGKSRKFGFVGFKDDKSAGKAKNKFNNTYLGVSKIQVDFAKTETNAQLAQPNKSKKQAKQEEQKAAEKFNQYKKVVSEGIKKSWDDMVVPEGGEVVVESAKKKSKKQKIQEKKKEKEVEMMEGQSKKLRHHVEVKPIKAPKLTEKNKKYLSKALEVDETRLYITNIPYTIGEDDVRKSFEKFGVIKKIKLPVEYDGKNKGYVFVTYEQPGEALRAFHQMDNKITFGRILHVKPAVEDIGSVIKQGKQQDYQNKIKELYGDAEEEKTSYKKRKKKEMREKLNDTTSWNTLFLNPNTVLERMSSKLGITKSEILLSEDLAPKVALAEAEVIQETKEWMVSQSINVDFLGLDRDACERSTKVLLIKNLNYRVSENDLSQLLNFYGLTTRILLAPNRSIAIVEYANPEFAHNALEKLQNSKFKNNFLYLEYAPIGMVKESEIDKKIDKMEEEIAEQEELSKVVYVKNLNFETNEETLQQMFAKVQNPVSVRIIRDKNGKSMGYGFIEFTSEEKAQQAIKKLQNHIIDGHRVMLSMSKKKADLQNYQKIKELKAKIKKEEAKGTKLTVKNLAFQATKKDVRDLFKHFGLIKAVRLPKQMNGRHRGYCFVEFDTVEEAALAKEALGSSHLYGRKLVIEYEKGTN